jgi:ribosome-binding protein aMBF1 (putative translation factor)
MSDPIGPGKGGGRLPVFPGFRQMAQRRQSLVTGLVARRRALGLSQTEVAARMGTSQSAVARIEAGATDVRLTTLERYAAVVGCQLDWQLREGDQG